MTQMNADEEQGIYQFSMRFEAVKPKNGNSFDHKEHKEHIERNLLRNSVRNRFTAW